MFDLKGFRKEKKLTQMQLSLLLDMPQSFIASIEKGHRPMPQKHIDTLSETYGDLSIFFKEEDEVSDKITSKEFYQFVKQMELRLAKKDDHIETLLGLLKDEIAEIKTLLRNQ